jgi:hypothetical protein
MSWNVLLRYDWVIILKYSIILETLVIYRAFPFTSCTLLQALQRVKAIASACETDVDLLRVLVKLVVRVALDARPPAARPTHLQRPMTTFEHVWSLVAHMEHQEKSFLEIIEKSAALLTDTLPQSVGVAAAQQYHTLVHAVGGASPFLPATLGQSSVQPSVAALDDADSAAIKSALVSLMVGLVCRINSNAHGLGDGDMGSNAQVAFGLFPIASRVNHSCAPNCHYTGTRLGRISFRSVRPIQKGEEITVRYVDMLTPRGLRQEELLATKHFHCQCPRCVEPINTSVDRCVFFFSSLLGSMWILFFLFPFFFFFFFV